MKKVYFLSDFGNGDAYAGVVRALAGRSAPVIDLAHDLPAGDIMHAAFQLYSAVPFLEAGAVVLAVVDPGVGGPRRPLVVRGKKLWYVVPDNGILSLATDADPPERAWELDPAKFTSEPISNTFHGRDVFAVAAALLAGGFPAAGLGLEVEPDSLVHLEPGISHSDEGEVITFDRFGNAITNLAPAETPEAVSVVGRYIPFARTFSDVAPGEALAYLGSSGLVEIAINGGSLREELRLLPGAAVNLLAPEEEPPLLALD